VSGRFFAEAFITLMVIMDPLSAVPIFLGLTAAMTHRARERAAAVAVITALGVIGLFALAGQALLSYLGITVAAIQVSGGLLLLLVALQLLTEGDGAPTATAAQRENIAMVPLGTPLLAGPGAIAATIVFVRRVDGAPDAIALALAIVAIHVVLFGVLRFAWLVRRLLGDTAILLISRVAGLLLAAIAVQLVADGVTAFVAAA
jgi:multiple antibiotic resistance protein